MTQQGVDVLNKVVVAMNKCDRPRKHVGYNIIYKLCCYEIVSYVRLKEKRFNPMTH